jgi:hypothetical protein
MTEVICDTVSAATEDEESIERFDKMIKTSLILTATKSTLLLWAMGR